MDLLNSAVGTINDFLWTYIIIVVLVDDAGADLRMRILAAVGGKERHAHKILIP